MIDQILGLSEPSEHNKLVPPRAQNMRTKEKEDKQRDKKHINYSVLDTSAARL